MCPPPNDETDDGQEEEEDGADGAADHAGAELRPAARPLAVLRRDGSDRQAGVRGQVDPHGVRRLPHVGGAVSGDAVRLGAHLQGVLVVGGQAVDYVLEEVKVRKVMVAYFLKQFVDI